MIVWLVFKCHGYEEGGDEMVAIFASQSSASVYADSIRKEAQFGSKVSREEVRD